MRGPRKLAPAAALALAAAAGAAGPGVLEERHGFVIRDPFRALEDPAAAAGWLRVQDLKTRAALRDLGPPGARARLSELLSIGLVARPHLAGGRLFFLRRRGDQEQPVLVVAEGGAERVLVDPTRRGRGWALDWFYPSPRGRRVAYGLSQDGDEESRLWVLEVADGAVVDGPIPDTRACGLAWLPGGEAFHYTRSPPGGGLYHRKVYRHVVGEDPRRDRLVLGAPLGRTDWPRPRPGGPAGDVFVEVSRGWTRNELWWVRPGEGPARLFGDADAHLEDPQWVGGLVLARTDLDAPRGRLVLLDPAAPAPERWRTLVPEGEGVLEDHRVVGARVLVHRRVRGASRLEVHDLRVLVHRRVRGASRLEVHDLRGRALGGLPLPELGSLGPLEGGGAEGAAVASFSSLLLPPRLLRLDPGRRRLEVLAEVPAELATEELVVRQVEVPSSDGVRVPMFLAHREGLVRDGGHPTLVQGYGGFGVTTRPEFRRNLHFWLERGGVVALPGLRGGGEYGEAWHRAGRRHAKPQVFRDFEYALRWLIAEGYTRPARLAIQGSSNGGLLVGAMLTRAPYLFAAAIGSVGLYDMVRYPRFPPAELWLDEYGDPERAEDLGVLLGYSPYHQVLDGVRYPAALLTTAARDTRVHWAHTAKFVARLQQAQAGEAPILLRVYPAQGHGAGKGRSDVIAEYRERYAFLFEHLGVGRP